MIDTAMKYKYPKIRLLIEYSFLIS